MPNNQQDNTIEQEDAISWLRINVIEGDYDLKDIPERLYPLIAKVMVSYSGRKSTALDKQKIAAFPTRFKAKRIDTGEWVEGSFIVRQGRFGCHYSILVLTHDLEESDQEYDIDQRTLQPADKQYSDYLNMDDH